MATLTSTKIKNTYDALLKASDNDAIGSSAKQITDGLGNGTPLYISTTQIGIGVTPEATYDLHVYSNAKVGGNLTVTGDLTVEGTTTTIDTQTLTVEDPLIEVANNNTSTDAVDIGWYGKYAPSGTTLYAGLFRDTGDSKFKLFRNLEEQPTTTINTGGTGYTKADLVIGGLEATTGDFTDTVTVDGDIEVENSSGFGRIEIGGSSGGYIDLKSPFSDDFDLRLYTAGTNAQINAISGELDITAYTNINLQNQGTDVLTIESSRVLFSQQAVFGNDIKALFGGSSDLQIYHSATGDSYIANNTGDLIINSSGITGTAIKDEDNMASDSASHLATQQSIKAYVDNSVGNSTLAEVLVNGNTTSGTDIAVSSGDDITFVDDSKAIFGTDGDLEIYHYSITDTAQITINGKLDIRANTLQLKNYSGETYFRGASNGAVRLYYDGVEKFITTSTGISVTDTVSATTFSGQLDGTISSTTTATTQTQGDNSTKVATTAYVDSAIGDNNELSEVLANGNTTGGTDIAVSAGDDITFATDSKAIFGASNQLQIYYNDTIESNIYSSGLLYLQSDDLRFTTTAAESMATFTANGAVELFYDAQKKLETTSGGVLVTGDINLTGTAIYKNSGTLEVKAQTVNIKGVTTNENLAGFTENGAVDLYYDNSKKFETTSTGVQVTGGASFTDNIDINGNNKHIRWVDTYGNWLIEAGDGANNFKIHSQSLAADYLTLEGGGQLNLGEYGSGSFTGTATYRLAVDSSGDVIEIPIGGGAVDGSGTANTVTMWSDTDTITDAPITISGNNATFAGKILVGTGATAAASLNAYTQTVSANLYSALRIIENSGASSYWDIGATGGGSPDLNFYVNGGTTPKLTIDSSGTVIGTGTYSAGSSIKIFEAQRSGGAVAGDWSYDDATTDMSLGTSTSHKFSLKTGNTRALTIDSSQNVGIGTTDPLEKLNIVETTATAGTFFPVAISGARYQADYGVGIAFRPENNSSSYANKTAIVGSGGGYGYNMADLHFCFNNSTTITDEVSLSDAKVTMKRSGYVGISTTNPTNGKLEVQQSATTAALWVQTGGTTNSYTIADFRTGTNAPALAIKGNGDVLVGAESFVADSLRIDSNGIISTSRTGTSTQTHHNFYNGNGLVGTITTNGSATAYNTSSDYRLKENVVEMTGALDRVSQLKPSRFNFIGEEKIVDGFLAHEVQDIVPEAITGEKDATYQHLVSEAVEAQDAVEWTDKPTLDNTKVEIQEWLDDNNIEWQSADTKQELLDRIPEYQQEAVEAQDAVYEIRPEYQGIDQSKLVPLLVGAIQELKAEIETLKQQINN